MISFTSENWHQVLESPVPVLIEFWSPDCQPCKAIARHLEALQKEITDTHRGMNLGCVNIYEAANIGISCQVLATPTILVFSQGKEVDRLTGSGFIPLMDLAKKHWVPVWNS